MSARLLMKPLHGGAFGDGKYALATLPHIDNGLHCVKYMVVEPISGAVLASEASKLGALAAARTVLHATTDAANDPQWEQATLWAPSETPPSVTVAPKRISQRRRSVFAKSQGRCHYCCKPLMLNGLWHVEHLVPKALDGTEDPLNLVASCPTCNLRKRDKTALEFIGRSIDAPPPQGA
jgi:5-methylcytosine-specific restriction endonuclease McrA